MWERGAKDEVWWMNFGTDFSCTVVCRETLKQNQMLTRKLTVTVYHCLPISGTFKVYYNFQ